MDRAQAEAAGQRLVEATTGAVNAAVLDLNAAGASGTDVLKFVGCALAQVYFDLVTANMAEGQTFADLVTTVTALTSGSYSTVVEDRATRAGITPFAPEDLGPRVIN